MLCRRAGCSLQAQEARLQFCQRQVFHRKLRNQDCSFTRVLISAVASRCFPHPTLSLASEQTLQDLKRSQGHQRGGEEWIWLTGLFRLHRNWPLGVISVPSGSLTRSDIRKSQSPFVNVFRYFLLNTKRSGVKRYYGQNNKIQKLMASFYSKDTIFFHFLYLLY